MSKARIFDSSQFFQAADGEPIRSVVTESPDAVVVAWHVNPDQKISPHIHPSGQDTWTIISGYGEYYLDEIGTTQTISSGDIVIAHAGSVHGVFNNGNEPLVFISVVCPATAGYQLVEFEGTNL